MKKESKTRRVISFIATAERFLQEAKTLFAPLEENEMLVALVNLILS